MSLKKLLSVKKNQRGVSMVEYTLLLSFIAIVAIVNLAGTGKNTTNALRATSVAIETSLANGTVKDGQQLPPE